MAKRSVKKESGSETLLDKNNKKSGPDKKKKQFSWTGFCSNFRAIWCCLWPKGKPLLQLRFFISLLLIVANRCLNVFLPILYKEIVDCLTPHNLTRPGSGTTDDVITPQHPADVTTQISSNLSDLDQGGGSGGGSTTETGVEFCWQYILLMILCKLLNGGGGYINCLRGLLWINVSQNAQKKMRLRVFRHINNLSVKWHQEVKRTGALVTLIDRGVMSMNQIISNLFFNVLPTLTDIVVAFIFFITVLNLWIALIVLASVIGYLVATICLGEWRAKFKQGMIRADNERNAVFVDTVLNIETVKCFTGEETELKRFEERINVLQSWDWKADTSSKMIMAIQKTMMVLGSMGVSLLSAWYVWKGTFTVGDFVLFLTYVDQLYSPLLMFSACYRILQESSLSMEHMMELLAVKPDVTETDGARKLQVSQGQIEFSNVSFQYTPNKPVLKDISFVVPSGKTYAIVGESGGGKSSILKLLFRFYDVTMGCITIDGTDISKVTQKSLRQNLGMIPQHTGLFNEDIRYNIKYSRQQATDEQMEDAARKANIHDKVKELAQGYETRVGESGVKLSGGEKRRVVIARTVLEGAQIMLLDEATTGLDNKTEQEVQQSLENLCENKTTLIVSHQLASVKHADQVLVLKDGAIVERGTHTELRKLRQHYNELWLIEHPEDSDVYSVVSDFTKQCSITECSCICHQDDETCTAEKCCCSCHDIEVEMEVLAALKLQSEEGYSSDEEEIVCEVKGEEKPQSEDYTSSPEVFSPKSPKDLVFDRSERIASDTESLLETIHEVPSVEEKEEDPNGVDETKKQEEEKKPLAERRSQPKLAAIGPQASVTGTPKMRPKLSKLQSQVSVEDIMPGIGELDDVKLIVSGKSYNIKPRRPFHSDGYNMYDNKLDRSLPSAYKGSITPTYTKQRPALIRSKTVDTTHVNPQRTFKELHDERLKQQKTVEKAREKKREHAHSVIDDMSSIMSLTPDDLAMCGHIPDYLHEDTIDVLCASVNVPSSLEDIKKQSSDEPREDRGKNVTINMPV